MAEQIIAYCVKERAKKPMRDARQVTLKNGKRAFQGVCSSCGTRMLKFVSSKKEGGVQVDDEVQTGQDAMTSEEVTATQEVEPSQEPTTAPTE
jgi:hypothetical protein